MKRIMEKSETLMFIPSGVVRLPLRLIPDAVHTAVLARICNHLLRGQAIATRLKELDGRSLCIHITDASSHFYFQIQGERLQPARHRQADVTIHGRLNDFWLLATQREDPDTLFFNRRLCLEGDTDTGVHIKNLLDALEFDWEAHFRSLFGGGIASKLLPLVFSKRR